MGTTAVAKRETTQMQKMTGLLQSEGMLKQLRMACTRAVTPERIARIALTELRRTPKLQSCSQESFLGALMQCAQLGLEPGPMGLAYLIPYGNECQFQIGYKGLINLMWRSKMISSIQAEVVYEGDHFEHANGIPPLLKHVVSESRPEGAKPTHVYCVIGTTSGGWIFRVMTHGEVEEIRTKYSQVKRADSPWKTSWDEMACKTVMKRTAKRAPVSSEVQTAVALDDLADVGVAQQLGEATLRSQKPSASAAQAALDNAQEPAPEIDEATGEIIPDDFGGQS